MKFPLLFGRLGSALAGLILVAAVLSGCGRSERQSRGAQAVPVQTAVAEQRDVPILQIAIGTIQPMRTVAVKSQVDGVISQIHFREGDEVAAGDLLVTLDRRPFENVVRSAEAELANARAQRVQAAADAERYQSLDQQAMVSKEQLAQYQTRAESAEALVQAREAALATARLQLSYTEIRAPIAGRTGQLNLHEGALVRANDAGAAILTINQLAPIYVAYSVPESTLRSVRAALAAGEVKVFIRPHASGAETIEGRLDFVDNTADPNTGTILLKAVFGNEDRRLWPGVFVDVTTVVGEDKGAILVPTPAIQTGQRGSQVFVVKRDQTVELRPVKVGRQSDGNSVLLQGVAAGEMVVTDGQLRLVPGARIEAKSNAPAGVAKSEPEIAPAPKS